MITDTLRIDLDSIRRYRNQHEWRPVNRARCDELNLESVGDGDVIKNLCKIIRQQEPHFTGHVEVWRGTTPVFKKRPIDHWLFSQNPQPPQLKKGSE